MSAGFNNSGSQKTHRLIDTARSPYPGQVGEQAYNLHESNASSESSRRAFLKSSLLVASGIAIGNAARGAGATGPPSASSPLRFGLNYIPRKKWLFCWEDWDKQSAVDDLEAVRSLGMDHIRAHCLWPIFQPGINYVSERALDHVNDLMDAADRAGLDIELTVLSGWMSGSPYMPAWTSPLEKNHNIFADPDVIEAEKLLFKKLADVVGQHKRFMGFDMGNEMSVLLNRGNQITPDQATAWTNEMFGYLDSIAPGKLHVNGLDHTVWWTDIAFTRPLVANTGGASIVHSYPYFSGALKRYGYDGVGTLHLVEYNAEIAYAYQKSLDRRVWVEEMGATAEWMPESYMPEYAKQVLHNAAETGTIWGFTWWCSHDIDPAFKGFKSLEYQLGLIDQDNHIKPFGRAIAALAKELRSQTYSSPQRKTALVIPDVGLGQDPDWAYATAFMNLVEKRQKPCIVIESRSKDEDYLRARGIVELIPVADAAKV
jgi:endo-1,4-beta-mannosidase